MKVLYVTNRALESVKHVKHTRSITYESVGKQEISMKLAFIEVSSVLSSFDEALQACLLFWYRSLIHILPR